jgi:DNA primase
LLREASPTETPEQRAAFRDRLQALAGAIPHRALASEYRSALLDRFFASRPGRPGRATGKRRPGDRPSGARPAMRAGARPAPDPAAAADERGRVLVAILLRHPALFGDVGHAFADLALGSPFDALRHALIDWAQSAETLDSAALTSHLTQVGLAAEAAQALSAVPVPLPACAATDAMPAEAEAGWWHIFGLMHRGRLQEEIAQAERDFVARMDSATQTRLIGLVRARDELTQSELQQTGAGA